MTLLHRAIAGTLSLSLLLLPLHADARTPDPARDAKRFVRHLYSDLLGRSPKNGEADAWIAAVARGAGRGDIARGIVGSAEHQRHEGDRLSRKFLGHKLQGPYAGGREKDVMFAFAMSAEYQADHRSNGSFVRALYSDVLNRSPSRQERELREAELAGGKSRQQLALEVINSPEASRAILTRMFKDYLGRKPDANGEASFLASISANLIDEVKVAILGSEEYYRR